MRASLYATRPWAGGGHFSLKPFLKNCLESGDRTTRYSTAGDSAVLNAQPIMVDCNKGMIAIAHNGNLVNGQ